MKNFFVGILAGLIMLHAPLALAAKSGAPPKTERQKIVVRQWTKGLKTGKSKKRYFPEMASPLYQDGRLYAGTHSGVFYGLEASNGKVLWQFKSNGPIASQPVSDEQKVFFGNNKGTLYALDSGNGQKQWDTFVGGEVLAPPAVAGGTVYVVTTSREVYALRADSGAEVWSTSIRGFERKFTMRGTAPVIYDGGKLVIGFADGQVVSLSARDGSLLWSTSLAPEGSAFKDLDAAVLVDGGHLYAVGYYGLLAKLEKGSGRVVWKKEVRSGTNMAIDGNAVYVTSTDGLVIAFDKSDGTRHWEVPLYSGTLSSPTLIGSNLLVGTERGKAFVFEAASGRLLQSLGVSSGYLSDAVANEGEIFVLSSSGALNSFRTTSSGALSP